MSADLHVHHREKAEKVSHKIWSWTPSRLAAELAKCDVLCGSCHRKLHADERRAEAVARWAHGTRQRYRLGCDCASCKHANALSARTYRLTRRIALTHPLSSLVASIERDGRRHQETIQIRGIFPLPQPGATLRLADGMTITLLEPAEAA